ncbi:hypothetical protein [Nocardioides antri]|uniref:DUF1795 domain-containing protein n=1 Tax=Nocardioides antri TaxID=2607659 RepID=A0A5B1M4L2_9ACTN|nr:hypothetical protein [Nocardioides antri]KAA1427606.1 hypothetical protein F0U47_09155 [Nocardioides antri]
MTSRHLITDNDVTLTVPRTWHVRRNLAHGVILAARPRSVPATGVCPEIVLRCTVVDADLAAWRGQALLDLRAQLADFALEDADEFDLGDHRVAYHRFAHRLGSADVLCDQWAWLVDGLGVTLTCSVAREDYLTYCDLFESIAATVDVVPRLVS